MESFELHPNTLESPEESPIIQPETENSEEQSEAIKKFGTGVDILEEHVRALNEEFLEEAKKFHKDELKERRAARLKTIKKFRAVYKSILPTIKVLVEVGKMAFISGLAGTAAWEWGNLAPSGNPETDASEKIMMTGLVAATACLAWISHKINQNEEMRRHNRKRKPSGNKARKLKTA
jgi:uncharacterized protein YnzC (UPF0291/DUF896 family)